ncbi:MAG: hypothetical protein JST20_05505 [Bacteroidetes bacterium]|nr:hypothetical protein [Bacteroidota bacterium]
MKAFSTFYMLIIFSVSLVLTSCLEDVNVTDGACDAGTEYVDHNVTLDGGIEIEKAIYPLPAGNIVFYQDYGDTIKFIIYQTQKNICTKEHLKVDFFVLLTKDPPPSFKVTGEVVWSALFPSAKVTLDETVRSYNGGTQAGLKQVFGDKPAEVDCYLTLQFESQGSQLKNIAYLREYVSKMSIFYRYSKHTR